MGKTIKLIVIILAFVIGNLSFCEAARPLYTEDNIMTPFGKYSIEAGSLVLTYRDNIGYSEVVTTLHYGLSDIVDLSLTLPYFSNGSYSENYDGLSDGTFKIKYKFFNTGDKEGAAFQLGYMIDTPDPASNLINSSDRDLIAMLIYSGDLGPCVYNLNFAYNFDNEMSHTTREDFIVYNASIVEPYNEKTDLVGETQYNINTLTGTIISELAAGFDYKCNANLTLDMAVGCGLNENSSSSNVAFGATYKFY